MSIDVHAMGAGRKRYLSNR